MVGPAESNWSFRPFEIFGSSRSNCVDLPSDKLLLPLGLVRIRPSVYHVELVFWVRERWAACLGAGVPDPCPERSHDDCVADARDGVLLLHEPLDVVPEGLVFLLCDLVKIPLNPRFRERLLEVVDVLGTEISPGID